MLHRHLTSENTVFKEKTFHLLPKQVKMSNFDNSCDQRNQNCTELKHKDNMKKEITNAGVTMQLPEEWRVETDTYKEPDGRECTMFEISFGENDPRSIVISYGPMPEGSDAYMEASDTYENIIGEIGTDTEEDPICEYDLLGTVGFGFEVPTEDEHECNFICVEIGSANDSKRRLFTILTTAKTCEEIDDLLDIVEQGIKFE